MVNGTCVHVYLYMYVRTTGRVTKSVRGEGTIHVLFDFYPAQCVKWPNPSGLGATSTYRQNLCNNTKDTYVVATQVNHL